MVVGTAFADPISEKDTYLRCRRGLEGLHRLVELANTGEYAEFSC